MLECAIVYLVMALGSAVWADEAVVSSAAGWLESARNLIQPYMLGHCSTELVQALLLFSLQAQTTSRPSDCWTTIAAATRISQSIGLHQVGDPLLFTPKQLQVRHRLWLTCTILDR